MESFQKKVENWVLNCFGKEIAKDKAERNHRFFEEAIELVQSAGMTKEGCLQLVDYVYSRPTGEQEQEVGGVYLTLCALCSAYDIDLETCGNRELERVWQKVDKIREKQRAKPKNSVLPQ